MRLTSARFAAIILWGFAFAHVSASRAVLAQPPPNPVSRSGMPAIPQQQAAQNDVTALYNEGVAAAKAEDWPRAREAFLAAWKLRPHYQIAANLGRAEFMMGKFSDAIEHLSYFLREAPPTVNPEERQRAQAMHDKAFTRVGTLTISVDAQGAEILIDGQPVGRSPLTKSVLVDAGNRTIEARLNGRSASEQINVEAGSKPSMMLKLAQPTSKGMGNTPPGGGMPTWKKVGAGVGGGLALVGLGVGIGFTVAANGKSDEAATLRMQMIDDAFTNEKVCPNHPKCGELKDLLKAQDSSTNIAVAGFVAGGIAAAGTVAVLLWPVKKKAANERGATGVDVRPTNVKLLPIVTREHGGLFLTGSF